MNRARLRAFWWASLVATALAVLGPLIQLFAPEVVQWVVLGCQLGFLLVAGVATWRYRPRPSNPGWGPLACARRRQDAITNDEPLPTALQRDAALDQDRRAVWSLLQQAMFWALHAVLWSGFDWSPRWLQLLCLTVPLAVAYVLARQRTRIAHIDHYDDTVPVAPT